MNICKELRTLLAHSTTKEGREGRRERGEQKEGRKGGGREGRRKDVKKKRNRAEEKNPSAVRRAQERCGTITKV
jgi:hypothetical protein